MTQGPLARAVICGTLTLKSPLHLGDGGVTRDRGVYRDDHIPVEVRTVATDHIAHPYLPGSSLKGVLRAWARGGDYSIEEQSALDSLFGRGPAANNTDGGLGGNLEVRNAYLRLTSIPTFANDHEPPYWNADRTTAVQSNVRIDRKTRTALAQHLAHTEFCPAGLEFAVELVANEITENSVGLICELLEGFNARSGITLGANTVNGWGRATWTLGDVKRIYEVDVAKWLSKRPATSISSLQVSEPSLVSRNDPGAGSPSRRSTRAELRIRLLIMLSGPYIVNDPQRVKRREEENPNAVTPNFLPLIDRDGCARLPSESLRGALRAQSERIWLTVKPSDAEVILGVGMSEKRIERRADVADLPPPLQLFGVTGWRSPLDLAEPELQGNPARYEQDFVAIDRFTGGGKQGAKFNAEGVYAPTFAVTLRLDLQRVTPSALGLFVHTLRDLCEGDVYLGWGATRGFGACTANVTSTKILGPSTQSELPEALRNFIELDSFSLALDGLEDRRSVRHVLAAFAQAWEGE